MSRFGNAGTFFYAVGDVLTSATTIVLNAGQLPQYPFVNETITDRVTYRSKSGRSWMYENYNLDTFEFNWSLLDETARNSLRAMYDSKPILSFVSGGNTFGTFRLAESTWKDSEVAFNLFDVSFRVEETV